MYVITLIPALFMTTVVVSYILYAPMPEGFGLGLPVALSSAVAVDLILVGLFILKTRSAQWISEVS